MNQQRYASLPVNPILSYLHPFFTFSIQCPIFSLLKQVYTLGICCSQIALMEIPEGRKWMYKRLDRNKHLTEEFREGVHEFLQYVISQDATNHATHSNE